LLDPADDSSKFRPFSLFDGWISMVGNAAMPEANPTIGKETDLSLNANEAAQMLRTNEIITTKKYYDSAYS